MERLKGKKRLFLEAYKAKGFNVTRACQEVRIGRTTFYKWKKDDPKFAEALECAQEELMDFVEAKLLQLIKEGNVAATIFFAKTQMKHRGYVERTEHTGSRGGPIEYQIIDRFELREEHRQLPEAEQKLLLGPEKDNEEG